MIGIKANLTIRNLGFLGLALAACVFLVTAIPPASLVDTIAKAIDAGTGKPSYPTSMLSGQAAMSALGVLAFCLVLWVTEALPFHITGMIALALLTFLKIGKYKDIISTGFGNDIVIFFIGVLILGAFITKSGLGKRISAVILSITGNDTRLIILGFLITGVVLSMWITDMAVAAMLMPLARAILQEEAVTPMKSNFGKGLMISVAWGALIGGIGTPAGTGSNPIALQFLSTMAGINLSFLDWMAYGVPSAILLIAPAWGVLLLFFPPEMKRLKVSREDLKIQLKSMPAMHREEKITLSIFILTVLVWVFTPLIQDLIGMQIEISLPALIAATLFFLPGMSRTKWKDIESEIDWAGIILIVSGLSLGTYLYKTGAAEWLAVSLLGRIGEVPLFMQIFLVTLSVCLLKVVFSSNTVTATILIPLIIGLGKALNMDVTAITLAAGLTSSLAFILVTTTPTNVIPFNTGYFSIKDMAKAGLALTVVASLIITPVFMVVGALRGGF
ncbi:MAG: solute carrier family 13 (sodium-dependent dicarboxylate transporter) member 2/3/5 [Spirochaetes bacterium]|nr:MAG: solute carrier family 13 (sodium-dependent dicarboxylate transporter) member 2/3/5 [Spirochaetota bacterium]